MTKIRPTPEQLAESVSQTMPDIIAPGLKVLFCGINPSVYSVVVGHHFARPGNRFWKALFEGGFTPALFRPDQDGELTGLGLGITNVVSRATVAAADLAPEEFVQGGEELRARVAQFAPEYLAVLGITAYRSAFFQPRAVLGLQEQTIADTRVWVLPNPSGLNAHYHPPQLARLFRELHDAIED